MTAVRRLVPLLPRAMDDELVRRARDGDRTAADQLFRQHGPRILRLCTRLLEHRQEAEDLTHDAFIKAFEKLPTLREPAKFEAWLNRMVVREARRRIRRRRLLAKLGFVGSWIPELGLDELASPAAPPDVVADLRRVRLVLSRVSTDARIAWLMRYLEGYSTEAIAEQLGVSRATARRRTREAERALAQTWAEGSQ
ncbi:MAG: RNA polymerase sigma factor [Myxococcota bacterium]